MNLKSDGDKVNNEWTAHLVDNSSENENKLVAVRILDAVELMREILDEYDETHSNNSSSKYKRKVVVKVDIEGMDTAVVNYMMTSGVLCKVDFVYVEHINENEINSLNFDLNAQGCPTLLVHLDDELFYKSNFPLPIQSFRYCYVQE
jgi:hypothetical protein